MKIIFKDNDTDIRMPVTPFHFGPAACIGLPSQKYIDLPVFILANVVVDIEPFLVVFFNLNYPMHGYCHTFLIGSCVGIIWALIAYWGRAILHNSMRLLRLQYNTNFRKIFISAILGVWFHVLLDAPLYPDIRPFYPLKANPLYGKMNELSVYLICTVLFIPAWILYKSKSQRS
ncbi:MAG: hydrolase [Candidatus Omnitrophota bacterium]|nr:MAG: hydrolase [Candidatus Omnitrophota bacterium]